MLSNFVIPTQEQSDEVELSSQRKRMPVSEKMCVEGSYQAAASALP
jgi:hypothetical protein